MPVALPCSHVDLTHLIHFDARVHALLRQALHERLPRFRGLVQRLLEQDDAGHALTKARRRKQHLAVRAADILHPLRPSVGRASDIEVRAYAGYQRDAPLLAAVARTRGLDAAKKIRYARAPHPQVGPSPE